MFLMKSEMLSTKESFCSEFQVSLNDIISSGAPDEEFEKLLWEETISYEVSRGELKVV